jgi:hypothetical protein
MKLKNRKNVLLSEKDSDLDLVGMALDEFGMDWRL